MQDWITTSDFIKHKPYNIFAEGVDYESPSDSGLENYHTLFRKKFTLDKKADKKYILNITADDSYKLYVNGELVSTGPANSYYDRLNYNAIDITNNLFSGDNVIAVHVYYHGKITFAYVSMDNRQGMWAELIEDGKTILKTDRNWKYFVDKSYISNGITWGYDTQFAENIDREKHPRGWTDISFDDGKWEKAVLHTDDDHVLMEQIIPPVDFYKCYAKKHIKFSENSYLLDFGKETVGYVQLKINSERGGTVRIKCGEELLENGHVRSDMRCGVNFDEVWTFSVGEDNIESFDYSAFRYLEFETDCKEISPESFSVLVRHYPVKEKTTFETDDKLLKKIWDICENAVIISTQEGYFDCPSREKGQYLGDLLITALSHFYISGDSRIYKKALFDFAYSTTIDRGMLGVAPSGIRSTFADYSLLYPLIVFNYYKVSGDKDTLKELLPVLENLISHYEGYSREDGLLDGVQEFNMVDWPQNQRDGYDFKLTQPTSAGVHNVINAYYYGAKKIMNEIYKILGINKAYDIEGLKKSFFNAFFDKKTQLFTDSQTSSHSALHSNVLPYYFDMTDLEQNSVIVDFIMNKGFACGVYFSYFILKALTMHGEKEKAMELILNKSKRSWYNMIQEGATACFEVWSKEHKVNASLCHPWASTPIIILKEDFES